MGNISVNLGGNRLGTGNKMNVELRDSGYSTHNISRVIKTTATVGTLIPFLSEPMLPKDRMKIGVRSKVKTHPTTGPLFGYFKLQYDFFKAPLRYYIAALHNNKNKIGRDMSQIFMPQMDLKSVVFGAQGSDSLVDWNTRQIAPDSALAYLGVRGLGRPQVGQPGSSTVARTFNATTALMYVDIYKLYYANQQEGIGALLSVAGGEVIDGFKVRRIYQNNPNGSFKTWWDDGLWDAGLSLQNRAIQIFPGEVTVIDTLESSGKVAAELFLNTFGASVGVTVNNINVLDSTIWAANDIVAVRVEDTYVAIQWANAFTTASGQRWVANAWSSSGVTRAVTWTNKVDVTREGQFNVFDLDNIDEMREQLLAAPTDQPVKVQSLAAGQLSPYRDIWGQTPGSAAGSERLYAAATMNGLLIKTHLSDRFNNWLNTDWIDGPLGITNTTAIDVSNGMLTMDALNLSQKVYDLLNRVVAAGATYKDWLGAVWNVTALNQVEMPMYVGGISGDLAFDEIISTAETVSQGGEAQPIGTLAGRGDISDMRGGEIHVECDSEVSFLMGIFSITPRVDYSQGNKWWARLLNMDEWHKPQLDGIGFQELITDEIAAFDTQVTPSGSVVYKSIGKQPAWIEYMTSQNETYGRFAMPDEEMFMTLTRLYDGTFEDGATNLTSYVDPTDYLQIFATSNVSDQHFWVQIALDMFVTRKMAAKMIPNL